MTGAIPDVGNRVAARSDEAVNVPEAPGKLASKGRYVLSETALGRDGPCGAASAAGVIVVWSLLIVCRGG